jgi:hypothetical protein
MCESSRLGDHRCISAPDRHFETRLKPLLRFHRGAESAGYPALLVASMVCLGLDVAPIGLLAMTRAAWSLVVALLSLIAAVTLLAGAVAAAFADREQ